MAYAKVRVLICDACKGNQHTDDAAQAGGLSVPAWTLNSTGGGGGNVRNTFVCATCLTSRSAADLFSDLLEKP